LLLDLVRIGLPGPTQPAGEAAEVRVDGQPGDAERVAEHHVRRLPAHSGQRVQVLHAARYLAPVPVTQRLPEPDQAARLGPVEPGQFAVDTAGPADERGP